MEIDAAQILEKIRTVPNDYRHFRESVGTAQRQYSIPMLCCFCRTRS